MPAEFRGFVPGAAEQSGPRVLKQNRGNGGQGVWKVELVRGDAPSTGCACCMRCAAACPEELPLATFMNRCEAYFGWGGCIIDQPFQPRLPDGMIRCYMGGDRVAGFGHQYIKALIEPPPEGPDSPAAQPGPRIMHGPDAAPFQALRAKMEAEWVPQMIEMLGIERGRAADHLGRRFPLRPARCAGRRQLRAVRDQCQLLLRDPGRSAGGDREAGADALPQAPVQLA